MKIDRYKIKKIIIILIIFFILLFIIAYVLKEPFSINQELVCEYKINTSDTESSAIQINNILNRDVDLNISLNGNKFISSMEDINLEKYKSSTSTLEHQLFTYVKENSLHYYPLSPLDWYHSPILYINSMGFGFCDDTAAVLKNLYKNFGFEARVVELGGHIVTEVKNREGKWMMYDPDYGVYFKNRNMQIASVDELSNQTDLIINPIYKFNIKSDPYTDRYAELFSSKDNNKVSDTVFNDYIDNFNITLPPAGKIIFPLEITPEPKTIQNHYAKVYKNLKVVYPKNYQGKIKNYLLIHSINGEGTIEFDGDSKSEIFDNYLIDYENFIKELNIIEAKTAIEINYFINPNRFYLNESNNVKIFGVSCDSIEASFVMTQ
jgi:hypothetical protein